MLIALRLSERHVWAGPSASRRERPLRGRAQPTGCANVLGFCTDQFGSIADLRAEGTQATERFAVPELARLCCLGWCLTDWASFGGRRGRQPRRSGWHRAAAALPALLRPARTLPGRPAMPIVRKRPSKFTIIRGMLDKIDELLRQSPERAHDLDFFEQFARQVGWCLPKLTLPHTALLHGGESGSVPEGKGGIT
jgi:hypothetical protein